MLKMPQPHIHSLHAQKCQFYEYCLRIDEVKIDIQSGNERPPWSKVITIWSKPQDKWWWWQSWLDKHILQILHICIYCIFCTFCIYCIFCIFTNLRTSAPGLIGGDEDVGGDKESPVLGWRHHVIGLVPNLKRERDWEDKRQKIIYEDKKERRHRYEAWKKGRLTFCLVFSRAPTE